MGEIKKTKIATTSPLSICEGFPMFPEMGTIRAGLDGSAAAGVLLSHRKRHKVWHYALYLGVSYDFFFGLCGPAFALSMFAEGEAEKDTMTLTVDDDEVKAGMIFGTNFGVSMEVEVKHQHTYIKWSPWPPKTYHAWKRAFQIKAGIEFDFLDLMFTVIKLILNESDEKPLFSKRKKLDNVNKAYKTFWGFNDENRRTMGLSGKMRANPKMIVPIDVVDEIPELLAIDESLHALFGGLEFGPEVYIGIPVNIAIHRVDVDGKVYQDFTPQDGKLVGQAVDDSEVTQHPAKIKVEFSHSNGFDLGVGLFFGISVLKMFHVSASRTISLIDKFGFRNHGKTYYHELKNDVGSETVPDCDCDNYHTRLEVILDPEGVV